MALLADCNTRHEAVIFALENKYISSRGDSSKDKKRNPFDLELLRRKVKVFIMKCMPNEITPAIKTYESLIRKLKKRDPLAAKALESAHGYRFQDGILYLR